MDTIKDLVTKIDKFDRSETAEAFNPCFNTEDQLVNAINEKLESDSTYSGGERSGDKDTEIDEQSIYYDENPSIDDDEITVERTIQGTSSFDEEIDIRDHEENTTDTITGKEHNYEATITERCNFDLQELDKEEIQNLMVDISEKDLESFGTDLNSTKAASKPEIVKIELTEI
ncbi:hypothetical protein ABGN28_12045 [Levilactobacillus brevis]|uniref:hypothetical protein n=1 Tax=Levilactobacillus brevis TaxID=1580 RepID=UPI00325B6FA0